MTSSLLDEPEESSGVSVRRFEVLRLHGKHDYSVDLSRRTGAPSRRGMTAISDDRLTLLYGANGSGKTSVLSLLFHALSGAPKRRHRTAIHEVKFGELSIELSDGTEVRYARARGKIAGDYEISVRRPGEPKVVAPYTRPSPSGPGPKIEAALASLDVNPAFLSDSRAFTSDLIDNESVFEEERFRSNLSANEIHAIRRNRDVSAALQRARDHFASSVVRGSREGTQRADTVYADMAQTVVNSAGRAGRPNKGRIPKLEARVKAAAERANDYERYGLLPAFPSERLLETLGGAETRHGLLLEQVLDPYLEGIQKRMDALAAGQAAISTFAETLNSFFQGKEVKVRGGIDIRIVDTETEEPIDPSLLSSGEKHLVMLLSNLMSLQHESRLFLIDEPELSLNPGWQRRLVAALLGVTAEGGTQLIGATHSIEIMARYRSRLKRLA